jgi:glycosyltransferase involved in cell wall biosynthesis
MEVLKMLRKASKRIIHESWLAFYRVLTVKSLERVLQRQRQRQRSVGYEPESGSLLYVAASSLPYHISGYTTRTHEVICALRAAGIKVNVLTRLGYPWDRKDRAGDAVGESTLVDDVHYLHVREPSSLRWPVLQFALKGAAVIAEVAVRQRVSAIHAASNHVNALPALLAARQLGIPFHYEMRGLWELTRVSRMPEFEGSQGHRQGLQLEGMVARHADRLFVISEQLGNYAREHWGVLAERMALLPNCIDPARIAPAEVSDIEPYTIGYAGSLIGYEGLDTLIDAVDVLIKRKSPVKVIVVGDGEARRNLEAQVQRLGLTDRIQFMGKVAPEAARTIVERCALVCIPRKPFKVCEIVPPIKLIEAMALNKPVIVPDLPVFRDELGADPAGWFFKAGDPKSLADVIESALHDPNRLAVLGAKAREYAVTHRSWHAHVAGVAVAMGVEEPRA